MQNKLLKSSVEVWRATDAVAINGLLNHPAVRPWVADAAEGYLDVSAKVADQNNILLMGEHGAVFFIYIMPGTYECHTQIYPVGRGEWAQGLAIAVLDWMFTRSNAWEVTTRVPAGHLGALTLARSVGFQHEFTSMEPCLFRGKNVKASILRLSIHEWAAQSDYFFRLGESLHEQMAVEADRLGVTAQPHEEDVYHNQVAGAAMELARHGLMVKGVMLYNRWCILARHRTISMVSVDPPVVRMDLGTMHIKETGIEIVA
jgi:hypothetical protein